MHIEYLLHYHGCVIVPGLGAFLSVRKSAEIDKAAGLIKSPYREICFNAAIINNDGMIANSIARRNGVSFEKGERAVENAVEELLYSLKTVGEVQIGSIGRLEREADGCISFVPRQIKRDTVSIARVNFENESADIAASKSVERKNPDYWYIPIHKKAAGIAASVTALVAVGMLMLMLMLKPVSPAIDVDRASVVSAEIKPAVKNNLADTHGEDSLSIEESLSENESSDAPDCYLIVGTFRTEREAGEFIRQQEGKARNLEIVAGGKLYRVSAASANSETELREIMRGTDFREAFKEAWIWKK